MGCSYEYNTVVTGTCSPGGAKHILEIVFLMGYETPHGGKLDPLIGG